MVEGLVKLLLKNGTEFLELLNLGAFKSLNIGSRTGSELLLVLIPVMLEFFEVVLLLTEELTHFNVIGVQKS